METHEKTSIVGRLITLVFAVLIPVGMGAIVTWARNVVNGTKIPIMHQIALLIAAVCFGVLLHHFAEGWKWEWALMFCFGSLSNDIMKMFYTQVPIIIRKGLRLWFKEALKNLDKK